MKNYWRYIAIGFFLFQGFGLAISSAFNDDLTTRVVLTIFGLLFVILASALISMEFINRGLIQDLEKKRSEIYSNESEPKNLRRYFLLDLSTNPKEMNVLNAMSDLGGVNLKDLFNVAITHLKGLTKEVINDAEIISYDPNKGTSKQIVSDYFQSVADKSKDPAHLESTSQFKLVAISSDKVRLNEKDVNKPIVS